MVVVMGDGDIGKWAHRHVQRAQAGQARLGSPAQSRSLCLSLSVPDQLPGVLDHQSKRQCQDTPLSRCHSLSPPPPEHPTPASAHVWSMREASQAQVGRTVTQSGDCDQLRASGVNERTSARAC